MKDICTISVVTFHPVWGDKASNLRRIEEYIECAYRKGSQIVIFPEMSLTGYDDEADKPFKEKMQYKLAETVPGPSTLEVAELTKKLGMYVIFGMPIRDDKNPDIIYNGLAIFSPKGLEGAYHKMHLPSPEPNWATRGDKPFILHSEWGPIGCAICYDNYAFPELTRYYVAKAAASSSTVQPWPNAMALISVRPPWKPRSSRMAFTLLLPILAAWMWITISGAAAPLSGRDRSIHGPSITMQDGNLPMKMHRKLKCSPPPWICPWQAAMPLNITLP